MDVVCIKKNIFPDYSFTYILIVVGDARDTPQPWTLYCALLQRCLDSAAAAATGRVHFFGRKVTNGGGK